MQYDHLKDYTLKASKLEKPSQDLPPEAPRVKELKSLNLDSELLIQYQNAKALYNLSFQDPTNQRTAVLNTITSILSQIVKLQADLYDAEYAKRQETILIATLKQFPELQEAFFEKYTDV